MSKIKNIYIVHHSHTDIGYTDLQESILFNQVDYIKTALKTIKKGYEENSSLKEFVWNCETYYCVEEFLQNSTEEERACFFDFVNKGNIGISASYLNFTDLVDKKMLGRKTAQMVDFCKSMNYTPRTAMNADINGISLGARDVLIENGIEFLFMNIHCHHGMYPLFQNQKPYYWANESGKKLLVWSGEHYNLGNALGIVQNETISYMTKDYFGGTQQKGHIEQVYDNVKKYLSECEKYDYPYDFIPIGLSGEFSDNAPPNPEIMSTIEALNEKYGDEFKFCMVSLDGLYEKIKDKLCDIKTYTGDLTDWWAHGIGSTPYAVKHYKEGQRLYNLCDRLDPKSELGSAELMEESAKNLMIYAEHTWGHSSSITNPYDTMVLNLDMRKTAFASKGFEAASKNLNRIRHAKGDILRYYSRFGKIKAIYPCLTESKQVVSFFTEARNYKNVKIVCDKTGKEIKAQISADPRGSRITFVDYFTANEEKIYTFSEAVNVENLNNTRVAYRGSEGVLDIVNDYDKESYKLPYCLENDFFKICYEIGKGVTSFYNKVDSVEMLKEGDAKFFTPIYEQTEIRTNVYEERKLLGRNIRGKHAKKDIAKLKDVKIIDKGDVFTTVELIYDLKGTYKSSVIITLYSEIPRIGFKYKIAKTLSDEVENIMLPLALNYSSEMYVDKSDVCFKPGVEQIPGTCMEYYLIDNGVVYLGDKHSLAIHSQDAPLIYMGELKHHAIKLCDNKEENNKRDVYSYIMNNIWETNFKIDLSGFSEFSYRLDLIKTNDVKESFETLKDNGFGTISFMI